MIALLAQCMPWALQRCADCGQESPVRDMDPITVGRVLTGWRHRDCVA